MKQKFLLIIASILISSLFVQGCSTTDKDKNNAPPVNDQNEQPGDNINGEPNIPQDNEVPPGNENLNENNDIDTDLNTDIDKENDRNSNNNETNKQ